MGVRRGVLLTSVAFLAACSGELTTDAVRSTSTSVAGPEVQLEAFCSRAELLASLETSGGPPDAAALETLHSGLADIEPPAEVAGDVAMLEERLGDALGSAPGTNGETGPPDAEQLRSFTEALVDVESAGVRIQEFVDSRC